MNNKVTKQQSARLNGSLKVLRLRPKRLACDAKSGKQRPVAYAVESLPKLRKGLELFLSEVRKCDYHNSLCGGILVHFLERLNPAKSQELGKRIIKARPGVVTWNKTDPNGPHKITLIVWPAEKRVNRKS